MDTYAIVVSLALGFVLGVIAVSAFEAYQDGREISKRRRKAEREKKLALKWQADIDAGNDADMVKAVKLVETELNGQTILTTTKS